MVFNFSAKSLIWCLITPKMLQVGPRTKFQGVSLSIAMLPLRNYHIRNYHIINYHIRKCFKNINCRAKTCIWVGLLSHITSLFSHFSIKIDMNLHEIERCLRCKYFCNFFSCSGITDSNMA